MVLSLFQFRRQGWGALVRAALSAARVWVPNEAGEVQSAICWLLGAGVDCGAFIRVTASGSETHCGAERAKRPANSMAADS